MTPQPDALPACPHCGGETYTRDEIIETNITEYGGNRYAYVALCKSCQSSGPMRDSLAEAIAAFTNPAHALAASRAECERLRVALFDTSEVCAALVEGEKCEHDAGICWCAAHESIVHARAALAAQGGGT